MLAKKIGIDLGTSTVLIYVRGEGIVVNEPSLVAVNRDGTRILAVGGQSYPGCGTSGDGYAIGRSFGHTIVVSPDSKSVYVTNFGDSQVSQYDVGAGGVLTPKSTATVVRRKVSAAPIRSATRRRTSSAGVSNGTSAAPSISRTVS